VATPLFPWLSHFSSCLQQFYDRGKLLVSLLYDAPACRLKIFLPILSRQGRKAVSLSSSLGRLPFSLFLPQFSGTGKEGCQSLGFPSYLHFPLSLPNFSDGEQGRRAVSFSTSLSCHSFPFPITKFSDRGQRLRCQSLQYTIPPQ
jgi:hypothetical protein